MQRLDLNLASDPFRNNSLLWVGYGTATVLLVLFTAWNFSTFVDYRARLLELRDTVGTFRTQRLELETRGKLALAGIRRYDVEALEIKTDKANEVIEWKAFSWTRLFNVLERVLPDQVRMNSVRPIFNPSGRTQDQGQAQAGQVPVAIEGTARSFGDLANLQQAFLSEPQIGRVEPERLDKTDNGEFVFQLRFMYVPIMDGGTVAQPTATGEGSAAEAADDAELPGGTTQGSPNDDATVARAQDAAPLPDSAPIEVTDPGPPGEPVADGEVAGTPASKAKRTAGSRQRSDPRRRRPASREDGKDQR